MISFAIQGGLGNMMFITATAEWLAHKHGKELCYNNAKKHFDFLLSFGRWVAHSREYHSVFPNVDWFKNRIGWNAGYSDEYIRFPYQPIVPEDGVCYHGYFQSAKNFDGDFARKLFAPSSMVIDRLKGFDMLFDGRVLCSIQVRRGNYLALSEHHVVQGAAYYMRAIEMMDELGVERYLVFSDGMDWCKSTFSGNKFIFVESTDYVEMFLMSLCNHNIISNSSFGWWGAFLGGPSGRKVIAPSQWFPGEKNDIAKDVIPDEWIRL